MNCADGSMIGILSIVVHVPYACRGVHYEECPDSDRCVLVRAPQAIVDGLSSFSAEDVLTLFQQAASHHVLRCEQREHHVAPIAVNREPGCVSVADLNRARTPVRDRGVGFIRDPDSRLD